MRITLRVTPNAKTFRIEQKQGKFKVYVREKAQGNKANIALCKELKRLLKKEVVLVSGAKNRNKVLEIEGTEEEVLNALGTASAEKGA